MTRSILIFFLLSTSAQVMAQDKVISLGIFSGVTSTYTWDEGILADPRYIDRYDLKLAPVGFNYGIDYKGFGFVISPGLIVTGQNYHVINTVGGHVGTRRIDLQYLNVPVALKFHLIDLSFFKISFIAGGSAAYLMKGKESIGHSNAKLKFPPVVYPILPPEYTVEYDGVISPQIRNFNMLEKKDFNAFQFYGLIGFRSDWDLSEKWRVSFDIRAHYGVLENRNQEYINKLESYQTLYDMPGKRRDIVGHLSVGIARYVEIEKKEKARKQGSKGSSKKFSPKRYPWPSPKSNKPKG